MKIRNALRDIVETAVLALAMFLIVQISMESKKVEGSSMQPTMGTGQRILVNKLLYSQVDMNMVSKLIPFYKTYSSQGSFLFHPPRRGEVLVFKYPKDPSRDFVKRVIGLPGETIEVRNGLVYINGEYLEESYVKSLSRASIGPIEIEAYTYFVMGDNRTSSSDSRDWGTLPLDHVIGKAWMRYWPLSKVNLI
jgi:signal peptidase I